MNVNWTTVWSVVVALLILGLVGAVLGGVVKKA